MTADRRIDPSRQRLPSKENVSIADGNSISETNAKEYDSSTTDSNESSLSKSINVLHVNKYYFPVTGGMQTAIRSLITGIENANFRVLTSRQFGAGNSDELDGTKVIRAGSIGKFKSTPLTPSFPYHLRRQLSWADLVHYHLPFPLGPVSHLLNRSIQKPTVVTFHDEIIGKGPVVYPYKPILDRFLETAERIIVTSPNMRDKSSQIVDFEPKTQVVPLGVETSEMHVTPQEVSNRHILFVGRLVEFKGIEYLISSMKEIDASLSIVGRGPLRADLERHADDEGVSGKVTFEGFVSEDELNRLYHAADIFVLPSIGENESFGIVQLEAMKRGLPVVNTSLPTGVPYVSVDGITGSTVPPGHPEEIAAAVSTLLEKPDRYRRYSINAQRRVQNKFSKKQMVDKTERIYRNAIAMD